MTPTQAILHCDLTSILGSRHFYTLSIGANRDILLVSSQKPVRRGGSKNPSSHELIIHHWKAGAVEEVRLPELRSAFRFVQAWDFGYVCVGSASGSNAMLFGRDGRKLRLWPAGECMADVQVSPRGKIWVSYLDQGVFGESESDLGYQGLVCLDTEGKRKFGFFDAPREQFDLPQIIDCYALNVVDDRNCWLLYYTGFPFVHIQDRVIQEAFPPSPEMVGNSAFAVAMEERMILFTGGYRHSKQVFWRDLTSGEQIELRVLSDDGEALIWERVYGRGADLFFVDGLKVWRVLLEDSGQNARGNDSRL